MLCVTLCTGMSCPGMICHNVRFQCTQLRFLLPVLGLFFSAQTSSLSPTYCYMWFPAPDIFSIGPSAGLLARVSGHRCKQQSPDPCCHCYICFCFPKLISVGVTFWPDLLYIFAFCTRMLFLVIKIHLRSHECRAQDITFMPIISLDTLRSFVQSPRY